MMTTKFPGLCLVVLVLQCDFLPANSAKRSYTAAVYEHAVISSPKMPSPASRAQAVEFMKKNLVIFSNQVIEAKRQNADIIVFPEDGLYWAHVNNRDEIYPYLEVIPDPEIISWSPCSDPTRYNNTDVQYELSCMAKKNSIYLVADMGDKVFCNRQRDPKCPADGRYQYNTIVVYNPEGTLLTKYHKRHLYFEKQFDRSVAEFRYFDTPFGRFGMVICFDLLFQHPAVDSVIRHNITDMVYPTAWKDTFSLLTAIGYHSSFARGLGINVLAADIHKPADQTLGSGIYTPNGVTTYYYNNNPRSHGKLLVSKVDPVKEPYITNETIVPVSKQIRFNGLQNKSDEHTIPLAIDLKFTLRVLQHSKGELKICKKDMCCYLNYERNNNAEIFVFGVIQGMFDSADRGYIQVCTLIRCEDKSSCGQSTYSSSTTLKTLNMKGDFKSRYIYPQAILSAGNNQLEPALGDEWKFVVYGPTVKVLESANGFKKPLISATLLARDYSKDPPIPPYQ